MRDLYTGHLSFRELQLCVDRFPPESATWTAVREATPPQELAAHPASGHGPWSRLEHLIARNGDLQEQANWLFASAYGDKSAAPKPLSRPGVASNVTPINDKAFQWLESLRRGHGSPA